MKTIDFSGTITDARGVMETYFSTKKRHDEKQKEIGANYQGEMAKSELSKLGGPPNKHSALEHLNALKEAALCDIEIERARLSEAKALSPDWKFLTLGIKLPPDMLAKIADRNRYDALLLEGLSQHCTTNGINALESGLDLCCYLNKQEAALKDFFKSEESTLKRENADEFKWADSAGHYDAVKAILASWESFRTYEPLDPATVRIEEQANAAIEA